MPTINEMMAIDKGKLRIKQLVDSIYHYSLHDYIADANRRDVLDKLFDFFTNENVAVISKQQLRVYEEMERMTLDQFMLKSNPIIKE